MKRMTSPIIAKQISDLNAKLSNCSIETKSSKYLLILDLNGTLIDRKTSQDRRRLPSLLSPLPIPEYILSGAHIYLRPHLDQFIDEILSKFSVAVWTSATPKNARPMVHGIFGDRLDKLEFVWDRQRCTLVPGPGHESKKELSRIWKDPIINKDGRWNPVSSWLLLNFILFYFLRSFILIILFFLNENY